MSVTRCLVIVSMLVAVSGPLAAQAPEVRFICFAPSPYTQRHDALRAGLGIFLSLRQLIQQEKLPLRATFYDGSTIYDDAAKGRALLRGPRVLVIGSSTWAQGSNFYIRRFFEHVNLEYLGGVSATAWATAGGDHTGGDTVIEDIFRTLLGMGAQIFSLGQKYMVFSTDERVDPPQPGQFSLLDCWFMDQFARNLAVVALAGNDRQRSEELLQRLGGGPHYYNSISRDVKVLESRYGVLRTRLNAAADPRSGAYRELRALLSQ
jgi:hypothetical protein